MIRITRASGTKDGHVLRVTDDDDAVFFSSYMTKEDFDALLQNMIDLTKK